MKKIYILVIAIAVIFPLNSLAESTAFSDLVIMKALQIGANGKISNIEGVTQKQRIFLHNNGMNTLEYLNTLDDYLDSMATNNSAKMNKWLAEKDYSMRVNIPPAGLAIASDLNIEVTWDEPGKATEIEAENGKSYPAVMMKNKPGVKVYWDKKSKYPVFVLKTKQGFDIQLLETDTAPKDPKELRSIVKEILYGGNWTEGREKKVFFPMINLRKMVDLSWLSGIKAGSFVVDQAIKEVILKMDEKGAQAKAGVIMLSRGMSRSYTIKKQFYFWITKEDSPEPLFVAYCDYDSWERPN